MKKPRLRGRGDGVSTPGHRILGVRRRAAQHQIRAAARGDGRGARQGAGEVADVDTILRCKRGHGPWS